MTAVGAPPEVVAYVSDLEGDIQFWRRYVAVSKVLFPQPDGTVGLKEGAHFVFGGDAVDHRPGDLEVLEELLALKRRYPDRVHFILGNRDINKLRLATELSDWHRAALPLADHPGVYWHSAGAPPKVLSEEELKADTAAARLRWILKHTMGARWAFEARRTELLRRKQGHGSTDGPCEVSDEEVVSNFIEAASPGGLLFDYISQGRLALKLGRLLFVHAGLPRSSGQWQPGWVPGWQVPDEESRSGVPIPEWLEALEELRKAAVLECEEAVGKEPKVKSADAAWALKGGYVHSQPGSALMQYAMRDMPGGSRQPSAVYNGWLEDDSYLPMKPDEATLSWLRGGGVSCVLSGHLPHGDAPLVMRLAEDVVAVTGDTSFASEVIWADGGAAAAPDDVAQTPAAARTPPLEPASRGASYSEILLKPDGSFAVSGVLSNGQPFSADSVDPVLGRSTADGWIVKGRLSEGEESKLVLCRNKGWDFWSRIADESEVELV